MEKFNDAVSIYEELIGRNQENNSYFEHYILAKQLTQVSTSLDQISDLSDQQSMSHVITFQEKEIENEYVKINEKYPKSKTIKIILLKFLKGPKFEKEIHLYLKSAIQNGLMSSFKELRFIYSDKDKTRIVQNTLIKMLSTLKFFNSFDEKGKSKEPQSSFVSCHYFLSSHLDKIGKYDKALDLMETVIKTNSSDIDLLLMKGKILKHKGEEEKAMRVLQEAQKLDPTDKCLGCKCAKYMIRAGFIQEGVALINSFDITKDQSNDSPCHWLLFELAKAYQKKGDLHACAEKCLELRKSFENIWEDQLDFHVFALTRMRLCNYVELLRLEDSVYQNSDYQLTAQIAIKVLLNIHDTSKPNKNNKDLTKNKGNNGHKNAKNKQKKNVKSANLPELNESILQISDPLMEALKFLKPLQEMFPESLSTHFAAFDIYFKKDKPLLMLKAVNQLQCIDKSDKKVIETVTKFYDYVTKYKSSLSEYVLSVIKEINL